MNEAGIEFALSLGERCAAQGYAVASGGARGVDITAMTGAIKRGGPALGITVDPLERLVSRRDFRTPIADELLTLATPFHPAARWQVGNAMNRNRIIYALAQAAVVVASSVEKGGTRSGALENLKANWVPLHVRDDGSPGNKRLIADGAAALPDGEAIHELDIPRLTEGGQHLLLQPSESETTEGDKDTDDGPGSSQDPQAAGDAFVAVWPYLAQHLTEPRDEREVAEALKLELKQAREWLKRAVAEGNAEEIKRPKRYVLPEKIAKQLRIEVK